MGILDSIKTNRTQVYFTSYIARQFAVVKPRAENRLKRKGTFSMSMDKYSKFLEGKLDVIYVDYSIRVMVIFDHLQVKSLCEEKFSEERVPVMVFTVKSLYDTHQYKEIRSF